MIDGQPGPTWIAYGQLRSRAYDLTGAVLATGIDRQQLASVVVLEEEKKKAGRRRRRKGGCGEEKRRGGASRVAYLREYESIHSPHGGRRGRK